MNIKAYIDYFEEIASEPREKQFSLLASAQKEICKRINIRIFDLIAFVIPLLCLSCGISAVALFWQSPIWVLLITGIAMLLVARVIVSELNARLVYKGLKIVLSKEEV